MEQLVSVHSLECPITLYLKAFVRCKIKKRRYTAQKRRRRAQENHGKTSRYNHKNGKDSRRDNSRRSHGGLLKWTSKSTYTIANTFKEEKISPDTIARIIKREGYTLRANRKAREGKQHPDRNAQFRVYQHNRQKNSSNKEIQSSASIQRRKNSLETSEPGTSMASKRKRTIVRVHDFKIPALGRSKSL